MFQAGIFYLAYCYMFLFLPRIVKFIEYVLGLVTLP